MSDALTIPFGLHWPGKAAARARAHHPVSRPLRPQLDDSLEWSSTHNVVIEGDNLEALKILRKSLEGKVRLIFIDPPYNTGQSFIYSDRFVDGAAAYRARSGARAGMGSTPDARPETAGRHHAPWLDMMLPRLELAHALLAEHGAIFITIDDHEMHHLRMLLDEIFGRDAFVACCAWQKVFAKKNKALISRSHDHVLIYARNIRKWERNLWPRTEAQLSAYRNPDDDPRGRWQSVSYSVPSEDAQRRAAYRYRIQTPSGVTVEPPSGRHWNGLPARTDALRADHRLWFGRNGDRRPRLKVFLSEVQGGVVPDTWWTHPEFGHNQEAKKELLALFDGAESFTTPKPTRLLRRILELATHPHSGDLVLDFFAGSGTTGHAVWQLNAEDGGNRRFVLVQCAEPTADPAHPTISALCRERLRRAACVVDGPGDRGFRALRIGQSEADEVELPFGDLDSVVHAMVAHGIELGGCIERLELAEHALYLVDGARLMVCPGPVVGSVEALAEAWIAWSQQHDGHGERAIAFGEHAFATEADRNRLVDSLKRGNVGTVESG